MLLKTNKLPSIYEDKISTHAEKLKSVRENLYPMSLTYKISCFNSDLVNMLIHPLVIYAYPKTDYVHSRRIHPSHATSVLFPPIHETLNYTYLDGVVQRRVWLNVHWKRKWIFRIILNSIYEWIQLLIDSESWCYSFTKYKFQFNYTFH